MAIWPDITDRGPWWEFDHGCYEDPLPDPGPDPGPEPAVKLCRVCRREPAVVWGACLKCDQIAMNDDETSPF
jgi:hypothetical protein